MWYIRDGACEQSGNRSGAGRKSSERERRGERAEMAAHRSAPSSELTAVMSHATVAIYHTDRVHLCVSEGKFRAIKCARAHCN